MALVFKKKPKPRLLMASPNSHQNSMMTCKFLKNPSLGSGPKWTQAQAQVLGALVENN
jgi:hypothetical protein